MFKKWMMLCITVICSVALVQSAAAASTGEEQAVANVVEELRAAMNHPGDGAALKALVMDELSYGHSNGKVQNKTEFIDALASGKSNFASIALSDQSIGIVGDTAVVRHTFVAVTSDSGKPGDVSLKILMVWKKHDGHWRLLARQAVRFNA
ncbi:MAG: nuclear transport factor 2 family protein [Collimonas sp.]|uniref:nuclear transport factor 2 family protein n=1 Tax=Collimonas sp. TaxID=1963772 RepID=UPI003264F02F